MLNSSNYCEDEIQMTHSLLYNAGWSNTLLENIDGISSASKHHYIDNMNLLMETHRQTRFYSGFIVYRYFIFIGN